MINLFTAILQIGGRIITNTFFNFWSIVHIKTRLIMHFKVTFPNDIVFYLAKY